MSTRLHRARLVSILWAGLALLHASQTAAWSQDIFNCDGIDPVAGDELRARLVLDNLVKPVDVQAPPGDTSRLFIVEQAGNIRILDLATDSLLDTDFLDISTKVEDGSEKGLLGLAFHPNYASNGRFFVNYTRAGGSTGLESVVARYRVSANDPNRADTAETVLLTYEQPFSNHNGGQLAFGPADGYLYISTGDGGDAGDPGNRAQNPLTLLGKILRIDVDNGEPYSFPPSNPFVPRADRRNEIWALGLRNPWRISFDLETGDLYIADVGQDLWEEINFQPFSSEGGKNYEWKVREGNHSFDSGIAAGPGERVKPILEYNHSQGTYSGCSITGGVVYRGCAMPDLRGAYFFADYCTHFIRTIRVEGGVVVEQKDRTAELNADRGDDRIDDISSFGVDGRGEIYVCDLKNTRSGETSAKLYRIVPKNLPVPARVFVRGNTNDDASLDLSDAVFTLGHLFLGNPLSVPCKDALDSNDDGAVDITDAVFTLNSLFGGGDLPQAPYPNCGADPTADDLTCETSTCE